MILPTAFRQLKAAIPTESYSNSGLAAVEREVRDSGAWRQVSDGVMKLLRMG